MVTSCDTDLGVLLEHTELRGESDVLEDVLGKHCSAWPSRLPS